MSRGFHPTKDDLLGVPSIEDVTPLPPNLIFIYRRWYTYMSDKYRSEMMQRQRTSHAACGETSTTVPLARTEVCGKKNTVWSRRAAILDPKFNEEHDARISFGHRARVQQPARAGGRLPGRLPGRQPARAHASNEIPRAHPVRSQNSDHACMRSCCMHARLGGRRHEYGRDCRTRHTPVNELACL